MHLPAALLSLSPHPLLAAYKQATLQSRKQVKFPQIEASPFLQDLHLLPHGSIQFLVRMWVVLAAVTEGHRCLSGLTQSVFLPPQEEVNFQLVFPVVRKPCDDSGPAWVRLEGLPCLASVCWWWNVKTHRKARLLLQSSAPWTQVTLVRAHHVATWP